MTRSSQKFAIDFICFLPSPYKAKNTSGTAISEIQQGKRKLQYEVIAYHQTWHVAAWQLITETHDRTTTPRPLATLYHVVPGFPGASPTPGTVLMPLESCVQCYKPHRPRPGISAQCLLAVEWDEPNSREIAIPNTSSPVTFAQAYIKQPEGVPRRRWRKQMLERLAPTTGERDSDVTDLISLGTEACLGCSLAPLHPDG